MVFVLDDPPCKNLGFQLPTAASTPPSLHEANSESDHPEHGDRQLNLASNTMSTFTPMSIYPTGVILPVTLAENIKTIFASMNTYKR